MKYNILLFWAVALILGGLSAGCIDDQGNYDYITAHQVLPVTISGMQENYSFQFGNTEHLTATVEGDQNCENLRYMWYIYKIPNWAERDTLGYGKALNYYVGHQSGNYQLWFEVRDTIRDVYVSQMAEVAVETRLSNAWLVMESENGMTDMDAIAADGSVMEDLVNQTLGKRLQGEAVKVTYIQEHSNEVINPDGTATVEKQKAFYLLSEKEMAVFNAENMKMLKESKDCFYEAPARFDFMDCMVNSKNMYLINEGKYHSLTGTSANVGKFSYMKAGPSNADYELHPENLFCGQYAMVWDRLSRSFLWAGSDSELAHFSPADAGSSNFGPLTGMDVDLKHFLRGSKVYDWDIYSYIYGGFALMVDGQGKDYLMTVAYQGKNKYPVKDYQPVPVGCQLGNAGILCAHQVSSSLYFAAGEQVWVHDINQNQTVDGRERKLLSFSGEEVTYIRHVKAASLSLDHLVVLTYKAGQWKMYAFPFIGGGSEIDTNVNTEDYLIGTGKGRATYCMRMYNNYEY